MSEIVAEIESARIGVKRHEMDRQIVTERFLDILGIKYVSHSDGDADTLDCRVRLVNRLSHLRDDRSQSDLNLRHQNVDGLDEVLVIPSRNAFHDKREVI